MNKNIFIFLIIFFSILFFKSSSFANEQIKIINSLPEDKFSIGIPGNWQEKRYPSSTGRIYAFWDNIGNAITITVKIPNSFTELLNKISNNQISHKQLKQIETQFCHEAPSKIDLEISIKKIANKKTFSQNFIIKQETLDTIYYISTTTFDFLHEGRQYQIGISSTPAVDKNNAKINFKNSFRKYFKPILITLFIYG